jgi:hypothetical protein
MDDLEKWRRSIGGATKDRSSIASRANAQADAADQVKDIVPLAGNFYPATKGFGRHAILRAVGLALSSELFFEMISATVIGVLAILAGSILAIRRYYRRRDVLYRVRR